jgi:hypothetical protein
MEYNPSRKAPLRASTPPKEPAKKTSKKLDTNYSAPHSLYVLQKFPKNCVDQDEKLYAGIVMQKNTEKVEVVLREGQKQD